MSKKSTWMRGLINCQADKKCIKSTSSTNNASAGCIVSSSAPPFCALHTVFIHQIHFVQSKEKVIKAQKMVVNEIKCF